MSKNSFPKPWPQPDSASYIKIINKDKYKKKNNQRLCKAAFRDYIKEKAEKSKLEQLLYKTLQVQPYLI